MGLNDYYDPDSDGGSSKYLRAGWHDVRVDSCRMMQSKKATNGVEVIVKNASEQIAKGAFWITPDALKILASFAKACGLTDQEMSGYDPANHNAHQVLINRPLSVEVALQEGSTKYHEIIGWKPRAAGQVPIPQIAKPPEPDVIDTAIDADIPF